MRVPPFDLAIRSVFFNRSVRTVVSQAPSPPVDRFQGFKCRKNKLTGCHKRPFNRLGRQNLRNTINAYLVKVVHCLYLVPNRCLQKQRSNPFMRRAVDGLSNSKMPHLRLKLTCSLLRQPLRFCVPAWAVVGILSFCRTNNLTVRLYFQLAFIRSCLDAYAARTA